MTLYWAGRVAMFDPETRKVTGARSFQGTPVRRRFLALQPCG